MEQALFSDKRWRNPYIDLQANLPEHLISGGKSGLSPEQVSNILTRLENFQNCYLELGSGSGAHLIERAKKSSDLFIGFELRFKRAYMSALKAKHANLTNVLIVRSCAISALQNFKDNSISGCYINFPDPWNKGRWVKHRMINKDSLQLLGRVLRPQGFLNHKSDHLEVFRESVALIEANTRYNIDRLTEDLYGSYDTTDNVSTEFEKLFKSKGQKICQVIAQVK